MEVEGCVCVVDNVADDSEICVLHCSGVRNCGDVWELFVDWWVVSPGVVNSSAKVKLLGMK